MGICFSEIEPGQQLQLEQLLATLSGQCSLTTSASTAPQSTDPSSSLSDVDPTTMLEELTQFFRNNHLLSREEFYQLAKRARR
jgi:hypothetical protein